ncbi:hypothetical protein [Nostoc sp. 'Peltigera membranacea cyanobiont' 232]|uniref:hypothetical protein n=1 Tax=Nostoc sp. 'Peltigera membranacea cyanobiont' 232 TaxID=2014531 RepID=UPI0016724E6C|nr:hypothetical protein [Nostoc sp. 'Peltigera membranacea cyanobiont' 232]
MGELVLGLLMGNHLWWGEAHRSKAGGYAFAHQNLPAAWKQYACKDSLTQVV